MEEIRKRLGDKTAAEIQKALDSMHGDLEKTNNMVANHVNNTQEPEITTTSTQSWRNDVIGEQPVKEEEEPKKKLAPLIYFSYSQENSWSDSLRGILVRAGYIVFDPWEKIHEQIGKQDVPHLDQQPLKIVKTLCPSLHMPEEVMLPFDTVWNIFQHGDAGDNFSDVFRCLWFLVRSSLVICDLAAVDPSSAQVALYAKQLGIPVIGIFPTSGKLNPWMHRATTALFSDTGLITLLPMIQGYAPL